jgi:hypothetical protein
MRQVDWMDTYVLAAAMGVVLATGILLFDNQAFGAEAAPSARPECSCSGEHRKETRPSFAELTDRRLDEADEIAALESIQVGLSSMDDGEPFVWRRSNGKLSGIVRPTVSFRNAKHDVCRHVVVLLTTGFKTRTLEGIACRAANRRWVLEG